MTSYCRYGNNSLFVFYSYYEFKSTFWQLGGHFILSVITGESGSGKSTLLFELAGLTHYSKNEFYTDSNDYGFVFQDCRLFDDLTAIQNIQLFSELAEVPFHKDQMMKLLDELDLNIDLNGKVDILSGGQKQSN